MNDKTDSDADALRVYFKEISGLNPLSRAEEIALARAGDEESVKELVRHNLKYVVQVANRYKGLGLSFSDLINEGNVGMIQAAKRFDPQRGVKFITYAIWWIKQSIFQALADQSKVVRLPVKQAGLLLRVSKKIDELTQLNQKEPTRDELAKALDMKLSSLENLLRVYRSYLSLDSPINDHEHSSEFIDMLTSPGQNSVEEDFIRLCLHHEMEELLSSLSERESKIIRLRFGFDEPPLTLAQIGERMKLTRERIRQIEKQAKDRLRYLVCAKTLEDYLQ